MGFLGRCPPLSAVPSRVLQTTKGKTPPESPYLPSSPLKTNACDVARPQGHGMSQPACCHELGAMVIGFIHKIYSGTHISSQTLAEIWRDMAYPFECSSGSGLPRGDADMDVLTQIASEKTPRGTIPWLL